MKKTLFLITSLLGSMGVFSQTAPKPDTTTLEKSYIIGIHGGTSGIGLNFKFNFKNHSTLRLGGSMIPFSYSTVQNLGANFKIDAKASYNNIHLLYEYQAFKKVKRLKFVAGFGYFFNANTSAKLSPNESISAGITTLTPEEMGDLTIKIDSKGLAPYLGVGLGKSVPTKKLNVTLDLGTFYLNKPIATTVGTKLLSNNQELANTLTENLKDYRWLPVLQLNLNYKIK
jgi:hypothetical protein